MKALHRGRSSNEASQGLSRANKSEAKKQFLVAAICWPTRQAAAKQPNRRTVKLANSRTSRQTNQAVKSNKQLGQLQRRRKRGGSGVGAFSTFFRARNLLPRFFECASIITTTTEATTAAAATTTPTPKTFPAQKKRASSGYQTCIDFASEIG